jgi:hypothetical protein
MNRTLAAAALCLVTALGWSGAAAADETGIAAIHPWVKVGRRTCFTDHYHYGSGRGVTQAHARAAAINSWVWPTDLEYGSSWANYRLAAGKDMKCARNGTVWTCDTQARPCRGH